MKKKGGRIKSYQLIFGTEKLKNKILKEMDVTMSLG